MSKETIKRRIRKITALAAAAVMVSAMNLPVGTDMSAPLFTAGISAHAQEAGAFVVTGGTEGTDYTYEEGVLTVLTDTPITIGNIVPLTTTSDRICVSENTSANITLNGVNIESDNAAFEILGSNTVTITLADGSANTLISGYECAGLQKNSVTGQLTIQGETLGTGKLEAHGGSYGAGIGGGKGHSSSNITINSGIVYAEGGTYAAGIGGGGGKNESAGSGKNITINGGTVTAYGGRYAAGIGGGYNYSNIGVGSTGSASNIIITGGSVYAEGIAHSVCIGGGKGRGSVTPTNGSGAKVYRFEIYNPDSLDIFIDGEPYLPVNHKAIDDDTFLYAYLTSDTHSVKLGDEVRDYKFDSDYFEFYPVPNASDFDLSTGTNDLIYNGEPFAATVTLKDEASGIGEISAYKYYLVNSDGTLTYLGDNVLPVDAGTYQVKIDVSASYFTEEKNITCEDWKFTIKAAEIGEIAVTDIASPAVGETLDTEAATLATNYTLGAVSWTDGDTTAKCDKEYTAEIVVTPDSNHIFGSTLTATVNDEEAFVTNNDDGTAAVTYTFEKTGHSITKVEAVDSTCTTDGNTEHYKCSVCNKLFTDESGTIDTTLEAVTIPAAHKLSHIEAADASCTESGNIEHYKCDVCGKLFTDESGTIDTTLEAVTIPAAHKLSHIEAADASCTKSGNIEHYKCDVCGKLFADENGETEVSPEDVKIEAHHTKGDGTVNKASLTNESVTVSFKCSVCGEAIDEETVSVTITDVEVTSDKVIVSYTITETDEAMTAEYTFDEVTEDIVDIMRLNNIQHVIDLVNYSADGSDIVILTPAQMKAIEYVLVSDFDI